MDKSEKPPEGRSLAVDDAGRYPASMSDGERMASVRASPEAKPKTEHHCSFCGKSQKEIKKLIAGPTAFICDECIGLCVAILEDEGVRPSFPS